MACLSDGVGKRHLRVLFTQVFKLARSTIAPNCFGLDCFLGRFTRYFFSRNLKENLSLSKETTKRRKRVRLR